MAIASWEMTRHTWHGVNGTKWDMSSGADGVTLEQGAEGFGFGAVELFVGESPGLHGGRLLGSRRKPRPLYIPLRLKGGEGSAAFLRTHQSLVESFSSTEFGRWTVETEVSSRYVDAVYSGVSNGELGLDPGLYGRQLYGVQMQSMSSDWIGTPVTGWWLPPEAPRSLWDTPNGVFFVMQGRDTSSATITNPGTYASYPTWAIDGYSPAARVGVGGEYVDVPFPIPNGKCLVIDTDPRRLSATMYDVPAQYRASPISERKVGVHLLNPVSRTRELGVVDFAPVPPGKDIPLSLSVSGAGLAQISFNTLWQTAY